LKENSAIKVQRWWKSILYERNLLRQKLIAARKALEEHKIRILDRQKEMESPSKIITDTDNSILQLSSSEKKIITLQNSEEEKEQHELQTA